MQPDLDWSQKAFMLVKYARLDWFNEADKQVKLYISDVFVFTQEGECASPRKNYVIYGSSLICSETNCCFILQLVKEKN